MNTQTLTDENSIFQLACTTEHFPLSAVVAAMTSAVRDSHPRLLSMLSGMMDAAPNLAIRKLAEILYFLSIHDEIEDNQKVVLVGIVSELIALMGTFLELGLAADLDALSTSDNSH